MLKRILSALRLGREVRSSLQPVGQGCEGCQLTLPGWQVQAMSGQASPPASQTDAVPPSQETTAEPPSPEPPASAKPGLIAEQLKKAFPRALWVFHTNTGACNGCDIEVIDVLTPYYDAERFGIKLVASPRHADVLLCCGPVTRQVVPALKRLWEAVPEPKLVIAIGSCAVGGGIWFDSYNVIGGIDAVLPVNFYIPGCPPRPEAILHGVAVAIGLLQKQVAPEYMIQLPDRPESEPRSLQDLGVI